MSRLWVFGEVIYDDIQVLGILRVVGGPKSQKVVSHISDFFDSASRLCGENRHCCPKPKAFHHANEVTNAKAGLSHIALFLAGREQIVSCKRLTFSCTDALQGKAGNREGEFFQFSALISANACEV